ncbi:MAG: transcription-repair coupling factor, partial [Lysobacterales bacterium]
MSVSSVATSALPRGHQRAWWQQPPNDTALAWALAQAARAHTGLLIVVARDTHQAHALESDLRILASELPVLHFPDWEMLPYDLFSPHPDIVSQRIGALYNMPGLTRGLLVVPIATLMQRLAPRSYISGSSLVLKRGQKLDLEGERRRLEGSGYRHVPQVLDPGDFAVRGALLDLYPAGSALPYRIEMLDTEVDTIRTFDPETQRSLDRVESVRLLPAREFPLDDDAVRRFRNALREGLPIDIRKCPLYQDIKEGATPAGIEYYLPLFFDHTDTLFDYAPHGALFALADGVLEAAEAFWKQTGERFENRRHDIERP